MVQFVFPVLSGVLQTGLFILISPILLGILQWIDARLQKLEGPPLLQVYGDLFKLIRIPVRRRPETTSWIYATAPITSFVCYALLGWAVPPLFYPGFVAPDLIMVIYLLGLARFITALAAMDTGTPFGGMGSSREMFMNVLTEPLLVLIILALTFQYHTTATDSIIVNSWSFPLQSSHPNPNNFVALVFKVAALLSLWFALAFVAIGENGLLPIDNPSTHLELTMIQKAQYLEYSGRDVALIDWGEAMRLTFFLVLLGDLLIPTQLIVLSGVLTNVLGVLVYFAKLLVGIALLGLYEVTRIKLRLRMVVKPWVAMLFLAIAALSFATISTFVGM